MTAVPRYLIGPEVAVRLAQTKVTVSDAHQLLAPTLFRSLVLSLLYRSAHAVS